MKYLRSCFEQENKRWAHILGSPQKLDEHLSKRLDSDRIIFSQRLNHFQMDALRNTQTADAIRLQELYQSIRNLEATIAAKRQYLATKRHSQFVSRLLGRRTPKVARRVEKFAAAVDRRSLREMQSLLFKVKREYRAMHKPKGRRVVRREARSGDQGREPESSKNRIAQRKPDRSLSHGTWPL